MGSKTKDTPTGDVAGGPDAGSGAGLTAGVKSPVKIGSVSTLSGPIGDTLGPLVTGAQVWVRWINDRGGLNGHPVQMKIWDDGGDPARHRSQIQEAVEKFGVVAFLSETAPTAAEASIGYIESKRIPVIGGDQGSQWPDRSPMYFIPAAYGKGIVHVGVSSIARRAAVLGLKKFGTITCTEVAECATNERYWHKYAAEQGLTSVYRGKSSLVQPDFTAECLAARNAGVEILAFSMDANSITRIAARCARQNYRPVYSSLGPLMVERFAKDPNLDGMILGTGVFPYVWKSHPPAAEFIDAMKKYAPGRPPGPAEAGGWVAGKTLQRAAVALPEPPTSAAVLQGLWRLKNETLDDLTEPITFTEGQPTTQNPTCGFDMLIQHEAWVSPDNFQLHCGNPT